MAILTPEQIAKQLTTLAESDLVATLAIMAGVLETIRTGEDSAETITNAQHGADALRLELNKWRKPRNGDDIKELMKAGAKAAKS
jgi:hypothetical protein